MSSSPIKSYGKILNRLCLARKGGGQEPEVMLLLGSSDLNIQRDLIPALAGVTCLTNMDHHASRTIIISI